MIRWLWRERRSIGGLALWLGVVVGLVVLGLTAFADVGQWGCDFHLGDCP